MTFFEKLKAIERIDQLIRMKATGSPNNLAEKIGVSRRCLFNIIDIMKKMNAPIKFCSIRKTYYYQSDCKFFIGFTDYNKIRGGYAKLNKEKLSSAFFLH